MQSRGHPAARVWALAPVLLAPALVVAPRAAAAGNDGPAPGTVSGVVTNELTGQPIEGALVEIPGESLRAATDASGRFRIESVPVGEHGVFVSREKFVPSQLTGVIVTSRRETAVAVRLHAAVTLEDEVTVVASAFDRHADAATGSFAVSHEEVRRSPGAMEDIGRVVQAFPGVAARDDQRNDIVARGGNPSETLILVDGHEIPNLSHFAAQGVTGGPITMLSAELVSDARFLAGGFPAPYGEKLSAVLEVSLREGNRQRFEAEFDLGLAGAGFVVEGPVGGCGSWLLSARRSYLDLLAGAYGLTSVPEYANFQAKAVCDLSPRHSLSLVSVGGWDSIANEVDPEDLDDPETSEYNKVGWRNVAGLSLRSFLGSRTTTRLSVAHSISDFRTDAWDTLLDGALVYRNRSREAALTARGDLTAELRRGTILRAGALFRKIDADFDVRIPYGTENVFSTDPTRINPLALDEAVSTWSGAGYLQLSQRIGSLLTATVGSRYERFALSRRTALSPRGGLTLHLGPRIDLSGSYGRYHQSPVLLFMKAHPDNATLRSIQADHYVAGLAWQPRSDTKVSLEAYHKRYARYPVSTQFPTFTMADTGEQYEVQYIMIPLLDQGEGRASGMEAFVQKRLGGRAWGQLAYAYSRTEQRALDGQWRPGTFDLPHVLSAISGVKLTRRLELSAKFTYTSGRPMTPFRPEAQEQNRLIWDAARYNAERAPDYHRLDLRLDRRSSHGWGNLAFYVELDNVYGRENVRYYTWNAKTVAPEAVPQIAFMAIGGINVEF